MCADKCEVKQPAFMYTSELNQNVLCLSVLSIFVGNIPNVILVVMGGW